MNKYRQLFLVLIMILTVTLSNASVQEPSPETFDHDHILNQVIQPYLESLKRGNITVIRQLISGNIYKRYRVLLEENRSYSNFLKKYYRHADFSVRSIQEENGWVSVEVDIRLPNREPYTIGLRIENLCEDALRCAPRWKIVDEMTISN